MLILDTQYSKLVVNMAVQQLNCDPWIIMRVVNKINALPLKVTYLNTVFTWYVSCLAFLCEIDRARLILITIWVVIRWSYKVGAVSLHSCVHTLWCWRPAGCDGLVRDIPELGKPVVNNRCLTFSGVNRSELIIYRLQVTCMLLSVLERKSVNVFKTLSKLFYLQQRLHCFFFFSVRYGIEFLENVIKSRA